MLAVFDMDGTLVKPVSSWQHIHEQLGTWESAGRLYLQKFLKGEISYDEFARLDTAQWKDQSFSSIEKIAQKVPYMPGAAKLMDFLDSNNIPKVIISGGLSVIANKIALDFGVKRIFANDLIVKDGVLTGDIHINIDFNGKLPIYKKVLKEFEVEPHQVMAVGDTNGDVPLFKNCGLAVAINPIGEGVSDFADYTVKSLAEIIPLLR